MIRIKLICGGNILYELHSGTESFDILVEIDSELYKDINEMDHSEECPFKDKKFKGWDLTKFEVN